MGLLLLAFWLGKVFKKKLKKLMDLSNAHLTPASQEEGWIKKFRKARYTDGRGSDHKGWMHNMMHNMMNNTKHNMMHIMVHNMIQKMMCGG